MGIVLFNQAYSFGKDAHGALRKEDNTHLANQISQISPDDQWGDECCSQMALRSSSILRILLYIFYSTYHCMLCVSTYPLIHKPYEVEIT